MSEPHLRLTGVHRHYGKGDTMVQRGTWHAWSNRSDRPVTVVTTMLPAKRAD